MKSSDVSLCVLTAPEALDRPDSGNWELQIPPLLAPLVTKDTLILVNKSDLLPSNRKLSMSATWQVSLSTGEGTAEFMKGFAEILQQRYHDICVVFRIIF